MSETSTPLQPDDSLIRAARAGDLRAFDHLVERYFGLVYTIAYARLGVRESAEDLAQEVFLRVHLHFAQLDDPRRFAAWLTRMTRNLAVDWQRRGQRASRLLPLVPLDEARVMAESSGPDVRSRLQSEDEARALHEAIDRLPADAREVVLLRHVEELDAGEIASRLGVHHSTVRRHLARAYETLRGTLEATLQRAGPGLRARRAARVRTTAIVLAAAGLSASQKTALAAAASAGAGVAEAKTTLAGGGGVLAMFLGFLESLGPILGQGVAGMGAGKWIALTAGTLVIGGGAAYYATSGGKSGGPSPAVVAPGGGAAAQTPAVSSRDWKDWNSMVQGYVAENPGNERLLRFLEVLGQLDMKVATRVQRQVDTIVREGWNAPYPEVAEVLTTLRPVLEGALDLGRGGAFGFPPAEDLQAPVPNFPQMQMLIKLLVADARQAEARGDADGAVEKLVATARLADRFGARGVLLLQHMVSLSAQATVYRNLQAVLANPRTSADAAQRAGLALHEIDTHRAGLLDGLRTESRVTLQTVERARQDPAFLEKVTATDKGMTKQLLENYDQFRAEHERVWAIVLEACAKPAWERPRMDAAWVKSTTKDVAFQVVLPTMAESMTRDDILLAHLRICEVLCAVRMGKPELAAQFIDPFSGRALVLTDRLVYSVGPDRKDDSGAVVFDSKNGTGSAGDIVARWK